VSGKPSPHDAPPGARSSVSGTQRRPDLLAAEVVQRRYCGEAGADILNSQTPRQQAASTQRARPGHCGQESTKDWAPWDWLRLTLTGVPTLWDACACPTVPDVGDSGAVALPATGATSTLSSGGVTTVLDVVRAYICVHDVADAISLSVNDVVIVQADCVECFAQAMMPPRL
jgi:hypothetical protein